MHRLFHWLMSGRRALLATLFVCLIVGVWVTLQRSGGMEALVAHEIRLRDWIDSNPVWAFAIGLGVYTAVSFVPGTGGKAIAVGWLYGFWQGVLLVEVALSIAAAVTFLFSRHLLREAIRSRYHSFLERLDENLLKRPALYVLMLRLAHAPYSVLNYTLGATRMPAHTFLWTTALGLLPGTMVFVFAGLRLPTLAELVEEGVWGLLDPWLIGALALSAVAVPLVHLIAGALRRRFRGTVHHIPTSDE
jgi:uncharacterized membrane protein YdjX (TVP38/TMEM64 family)